MSWTAQDKVLALMPKFSGFASLCGSIYIVIHVLKSRERRTFVYHRLLCASSCSDILGSSMYVLSTWPIPKGYAVYAAGNQATCNFSGTLDQFASLTTPLFSGSLAIYYLLVIRYGWREERLQKHQHWFFLVPLVLGGSTSIAGLVLELYNPADWVCWIAPFPPGCEEGSLENPCTRGLNSDLYRMIFSYAIVWVVFVVLAVSMIMIYLKVKKTENKSERYKAHAYASRLSRQSNESSDNNHVAPQLGEQDQAQQQETSLWRKYLSCWQCRGETAAHRTENSINSTTSMASKSKSSLSRTVMIPAILYMSAFYLTFIFGTIARLLQIWNITLYPIFVLMTIFFPLQGFWQFLIYTRPSRLKQQEKKQKERRQQQQQASSRGQEDYYRGQQVPAIAANNNLSSTNIPHSSAGIIVEEDDRQEALAGGDDEEEIAFKNAQSELDYISNHQG